MEVVIKSWCWDDEIVVLSDVCEETCELIEDRVSDLETEFGTLDVVSDSSALEITVIDQDSDLGDLVSRIQELIEQEQ